jgi:hypothetical protein
MHGNCTVGTAVPRLFPFAPHGGLGLKGEISSLFVARMSQNTLDKDEVSNLRKLLVLLNGLLSYNYTPFSTSYFMTKGSLEQHLRIFDSIRLVLFPVRTVVGESSLISKLAGKPGCEYAFENATYPPVECILI